jgi:hypothetical protein
MNENFRIANSVVDVIGSTPCVRLGRLARYYLLDFAVFK